MTREPCRYVAFGAGALGLGFFGPELSPDGRVAYVDIPVKADFAEHLRRAGSYAINQTGLSMQPAVVRDVDGMFKEPGTVTADVLSALEAADLAVTAVGEAHLVELAPALSQAALQRSPGRPLRVLCAENGVGIARKLRKAVEAAAGRPLGEALRVGDTVVGRMCKVLPAGPGLPLAVADGFDWAVVADPFHGMVVEEYPVAGLPALPCAVRPVPAAQFRALEDRKLLCHNGFHAVIACMGYLKGRQFVNDLREDAEVMALGRRALAGEAAPALLRKHGAAIDRADLLNYCDSVTRRVTCPVFRDPIARGVRGILRKLEPGERFVHSLRTVAEQGIEPEAFATGLAAAVLIAQGTGETDLAFRRVLTDRCGLGPKADADLIALVESRRAFLADVCESG